MATPALTVADYLAAPLGVMRVREVERLARRCAAADLDDTVTDLRAALRTGVDLEEFRRLHILISYLYHEHGAGIPLVTNLRAEVGAALALRGSIARATTRGGDPDVLSHRRLPQGRLHDRAAAD
jgi:hypothetical protein